MTLSSRAKRPMRSVLAVALALTAAPAFAGGPYTQTVFFGDSLTDGGFFRPLLPASVRPVTGQFTTNPGFVWSQYLADYYGTGASPNGNGQIGTNYAAGGARVGINTTGALGPIPSLATQTNNYLTANGGRADARALYSVWGGANDLFAITNAGADPTTTIAGAVASEVGVVGSLRNAGARYILVATVPDLGLTPAFRALGAAAQANGTALATNYNNALFSALGSNGLRVIPLDTFTLIREVSANAAAFGFTNTTGTACQPQITANSLTCNPTSYVTPDAPNTYLFADGVHPTSRAHQILSQYAVSVLEAPRQIAALPHATAVVGRARADRVANHLGGKPEGDGTRWWVDTRVDVQTYDQGNLYDSMGPALTGGVDWTRGNFVFGAFGGLGRNTYDYGNNAGEFDQSEGTLGGFVAWYGEKTWVNGQLSYSQVGYDVDRDVWLGPVKRTHSGSPDGTNLSFGVNAGMQFGEGSVKHGPVVSVLAQRIDVDGYTESNPTQSTALAYPDQNFDSLIGSIGWQATFELSDHMKPYAKFTYDREFEDYAEEAFARSLTVVGTPEYAVPGLQFDDSYATAVLGARTELFGLDANVGLTATIGQTDGTDAALFATFGKSF
ncbi:MAG: autotransporter domain-containing protein [Lysobacter sp.]|nr:MAG: autotransporter domain-containing protein [Lysobacter sp.]